MITSISILSILNGFAGKKECKPCKAAIHDSAPIMVVMAMDQAFNNCPDLVEQVAKEDKINVDLVSMKNDCARLAKKIETSKVLKSVLDQECSKCDTKTIDKNLVRALRKSLKEKANVHRKGLAQFSEKCTGAKSDRRVIEALLKSYSSELVAKAETIIQSVEKA